MTSALADAIERCLDDRGMLALSSKLNFAKAVREFSPARMRSIKHAFWNTVLQGPAERHRVFQ
jgi:hypothetical protein